MTWKIGLIIIIGIIAIIGVLLFWVHKEILDDNFKH